MATSKSTPADAPSADALPLRAARPILDEATKERMLAAVDAAEAGLAALDREHGIDDTPARDFTKRTELKVSIVIPVYNERQTIREIISRVRAANCHHQIVIVDDASTDGTRDLLLDLERESDVRVVMHGYNKGKGAALRTAFEHVTGDVVLIQDADLEYNPADYEKLLAPIERNEADVVYGSRFLENARQDPSWIHRFGNAALTWLSNATTGLRLTDMETCYKVFRRGALRGMELRENRFGIEPEFTAKLARRNCRFREVPISYSGRGYDEGKKIHLGDGVRALYCILRYAWMD
ncbi:MAG: glycosyltransferase family 2 protein [Aeoliella sp.]